MLKYTIIALFVVAWCVRGEAVACETLTPTPADAVAVSADPVMVCAVRACCGTPIIDGIQARRACRAQRRAERRMERAERRAARSVCCELVAVRSCCE